jgi:FAD/FMN-containing dehydrogenase
LLLQSELGSKISFPSSGSYEASVQSYWSVQNNEVDPTCIISPAVTADVSTAIDLINQLDRLNLKCPFAVRGGGHAPWAASTIQNGIVIDLSAINQVAVSEDRTATSVGPGARWIDAYLELDAMGLAISGGRVASVGVGGLTTGGIYIPDRSNIDVHMIANAIYRWNILFCSSSWVRLRQCREL